MGGCLCCFDSADDGPPEDANRGRYHDRSSDSSSSQFIERGNQNGMSRKGDELLSMIYPPKVDAPDLYYFPQEGAVDECAICLEEYDSQNPRTDMQCKHYFHLACVLEWAQRSAACPICNKEFILEEES